VRLPQSTDPRPRNVGILLAAGAGRRYGKPKVLVSGWLDTAVVALRGAGCTDVVLVLGAAEVAPPRGVTAITARYWHEGLSASVRAGLMQADGMHADYAVLHVIDTPDVGAAVVSRVLGSRVELRKWACASVFRWTARTSGGDSAAALARGAGPDIRGSRRGCVPEHQARRRNRRLCRSCGRSGHR
jgi:MobA-like NTP transferase domain